MKEIQHEIVKEITLTADEAAALLKALQEELNSGDRSCLIGRTGTFPDAPRL